MSDEPTNPAPTPPATEISPQHNPLKEIVEKAIADIEAIGYKIEHAFLHFIHAEFGPATFTKAATPADNSAAANPGVADGVPPQITPEPAPVETASISSAVST